MQKVTRHGDNINNHQPSVLDPELLKNQMYRYIGVLIIYHMYYIYKRYIIYIYLYTLVDKFTSRCIHVQPTSEPGFIGRLDSQKGYDLLLESLVEVLEEPLKQ